MAMTRISVRPAMACGGTIGEAVASGRLVELLADRPRDPLGIYAVYPQGRFPQPKLRAVIDFLSEHFKGMGPDNWPA